ncbi:Uncharacterized protein Fot_17429 [Forsythia ovata]|uniref:Uncharacterized protein n=1 Tax=Forsythia ovata TaxID=205694 RepID=A0ABD1VFF8_9LAMI
MAFWKSERSSCSSGTEIEIWRGERIFGAKKKNKIGRERRRIRVGISGEDVEQAMKKNRKTVNQLLSLTKNSRKDLGSLQRGAVEDGSHSRPVNDGREERPLYSNSEETEFLNMHWKEDRQHTCLDQ